MKKILVTLLFAIICAKGFAQTAIYSVTGTEFILSFSQFDVYDSKNGRCARFSPWFNLQQSVHFDVGQIVGFTAGLSVKNIGLIHKTVDPSIIDESFSNHTITKKFRTYNLGIPISFKIGSLDQFYLYGGYEFEVPLNYKEKTFVNNKKTKYDSEWFSEKTPLYTHSVFLGLNFPYHFGIKVRYYLTEFFNPDCTYMVPDIPEVTYSDFHARNFYISLTYDLFENFRSYYNGPRVRKDKKEEIQYYYE